MQQTTLSRYVKAMRRQYGLTQVDLSEKSGVGLRFVRELEQGKQTLRLDKVNLILNLFGSEPKAGCLTSLRGIGKLTHGTACPCCWPAARTA